MIKERDVFEKSFRRYEPEGDSFERLALRRDRKRRNQRIAAGVVGLAVFVAAAVLLGTVGLSDRTQGPAGGAETGPAETGPAEIPTMAPDAGWDGLGIPPEGVALSTPAEGEIIDQWAELHVGYVYVYADGRVIWHQDGDRDLWERRLSPEGVDLVRSGVVPPSALLPPYFDNVPAGAWADAEIRLYAPPRYAICLDHSRSFDLLPAPAQDLLRGKEHTLEGAGGVLGDVDPPTECFEVTTEEARALDGILSDAGFEGNPPLDGGNGSETFVLIDRGDRTIISFMALFPDGLWHWMGG